MKYKKRLDKYQWMNKQVEKNMKKILLVKVGEKVLTHTHSYIQNKINMELNKKIRFSQFINF